MLNEKCYYLTIRFSMPKILQVDQFYKFKYIIIQGLSVTVTVLGRQKRVTVAGVSLYPPVFKLR